jgi:penicillin-binding protein 1A
VQLTGLVARHAVLAASAVPIEGRLRGEATWEPESREGHASFVATSAALELHGELEVALAQGNHVRSGRLFLELPELACADAFAALPVPLRERLDGLVLDGRIGGKIELGFDATGTSPAVFDVALDNRCRVVEDAPAAAVDRLQGAYVHTLPGGATRTLAASDPGFVAIARLPAHVLDAFVAGEDARFFVHHGFDAEQLRRSFEVDMQSGRVERGGSTISQQLVKNLFLTRERTLSRKLLEALLTWRLESRLSKRRILEAYLNVIELGEHVYGIEAGARRWFGKPAAQLDVAEAAFLAALTPAPQSSSRRIAAAGKLDPETRGRVDAVLRSMWRNRFIDAARLNAAMREPLALKLP